MKKLSGYGLWLGALLLFFAISCKQKGLNPYAYDVNRDTIPPVLTFTVPVNLDTYLYGQDIHLVGTLTDLESKNYLRENAGKLKSLYINVSTIDPVADTVIKPLLVKNLNVDGKYAYTINEKTVILSGSGTTYCRLKSWATDYANHTDSALVNFTVH